MASGTKMNGYQTPVLQTQCTHRHGQTYTHKNTSNHTHKQIPMIWHILFSYSILNPTPPINPMPCLLQSLSFHLLTNILFSLTVSVSLSLSLPCVELLVNPTLLHPLVPQCLVVSHHLGNIIFIFPMIQSYRMETGTSVQIAHADQMLHLH